MERRPWIATYALNVTVGIFAVNNPGGDTCPADAGEARRKLTMCLQVPPQPVPRCLGGSRATHVKPVPVVPLEATRSQTKEQRYKRYKLTSGQLCRRCMDGYDSEVKPYEDRHRDHR